MQGVRLTHRINGGKTRSALTSGSVHKFGGNYFIGEDNGSAIRRVRRARAAAHFEWGPRDTRLLFCSILNDHEQLDSRMFEIAEVVIIVIVVVDDVKIVVIAPVRRPWLGVCKPVAAVLEPPVIVPPMGVKIVLTSKMVVVIPVGNHAPAVPWMYVASLIPFVLAPRPLLLFLTSSAFLLLRLIFLLPGVCPLLVFPPFGILTGTVLFLLGLLLLILPLLRFARPVFLLSPLLFLLGAFLLLLLSVPLLYSPRPVFLLGFLLLLLGPFVLLFFLVLLILFLLLFCLFLLLWFLLRICKAGRCDKKT
jgi:hypothetical protein